MPCAAVRFPLIDSERAGCAFAVASLTRFSNEAVRGRCYTLRDARLPERRSEVGVTKYEVGNGTFWMVDEWLPLPTGQLTRFRKRKIPTREQAMALVAKARAEAFEGRYFDRPKASKLLVEDAWKTYQPISKRDNDTWKSEEGRAKHLVRHLGQKLAAGLTVKDVDEYRMKRLAETTRRKKAPSPASLDREVELLKRMLNYAVSCGSLSSHPAAAVNLLRKPNVRRSVVDDAAFTKLHMAAEAELKP